MLREDLVDDGEALGAILRIPTVDAGGGGPEVGHQLNALFGGHGGVES